LIAFVFLSFFGMMYKLYKSIDWLHEDVLLAVVGTHGSYFCWHADGCKPRLF
jgi:hypothetical protein